MRQFAVPGCQPSYRSRVEVTNDYLQPLTALHCQGGTMKKSILIIMLCALQGACAQVGSSQPDTSPLLTFEQLSTEITVTRIEIEEDVDATLADAP